MKGGLRVLRHGKFTPIFTPMKVTIETHRSALRLRWTCPDTGKRKNLALGVEDSTTGKAYASTIKPTFRTSELTTINRSPKLAKNYIYDIYSIQNYLKISMTIF
jgi:RNase P subunit RPR2